MDCAECDNLNCHYESLTFAITRTENALAIADRMYDAPASAKLTVELHALIEMRREARADLEKHQSAFHPTAERALAAGASGWN